MNRAKSQLTLQHFLLQSTFLQAYRGAVRATRPLPDSTVRRETLDFFRSELERLRFVSDINVLKSSLSVFNRTVKQMIPSIGLGGLSAESGEGAKLIGRGGPRSIFNGRAGGRGGRAGRETQAGVSSEQTQ